MAILDKILDFGDDLGASLVEKAWGKQRRIIRPDQGIDVILRVYVPDLEKFKS